MKVKSIAECSPWSILQYFWPSLSDKWSLKPISGIFRVAFLDRFYCTQCWSRWRLRPKWYFKPHWMAVLVFLGVKLSFLAVTFRLPIPFPSRLGPDQARQNVRPDRHPNCWHLMIFVKKNSEKLILKKVSRRQQKHENTQHAVLKQMWQVPKSHELSQTVVLHVKFSVVPPLPCCLFGRIVVIYRYNIVFL